MALPPCAVRGPDTGLRRPADPPSGRAPRSASQACDRLRRAGRSTGARWRIRGVSLARNTDWPAPPEADNLPATIPPEPEEIPMPEFAVAPGAAITVPVVGTAQVFPVRNVYGVTRNYDPGGEIRALVERPLPAVFTKSAHWVVAPGGTVPYPSLTRRFEPEIELILAVGTECRNVTPEVGRAAIFGYAVGLDLTRRDLQADARTRRDPLDVSKWFVGATPLSAIAPAAAIGHPETGPITLDVNGDRAQTGDLGDMIWQPGEIVAFLSHFFPLMPGDLIFTGTPPGEVALGTGDRLHGVIAGVGTLDIVIGDTA